MFERFRKEQADRHAQERANAEQLEIAKTAANQLLESENIPQLVATLTALKRAWVHQTGNGTRQLCAQLEERIGVLKRRAYEQALKPCTQCGGRDFRISDERNLEFFGNLRLVVCEACGLTLMFWADLGRFDSSRLFSTTFRVPEGGSGPFR